MNEQERIEAERTKEVLCIIIKDKLHAYFPALGLMQEPDVKGFIDEALNRIIMEIEIRALSTEHVMNEEEIIIKYPLNWWQAVRERWLPKWWINKYPIKYKVENFYKKHIVQKICHHLYYNGMEEPHRFFLTVPEYPARR